MTVKDISSYPASGITVIATVLPEEADVGFIATVPPVTDGTESPLSIVKLAEYYGVTTDYLMGVSNLEKEADTDIQELRLTTGALDVLKAEGSTECCCLRLCATRTSSG